MSENNITDRPNPVQQDREEMAHAQQLLQEAVSSTDALREQVDQMTVQAESQSQAFERLLQEQLDRLHELEGEDLPEFRSEMEEMLLSFQQDYLTAQKQSGEALSSQIKAVLTTLTILHEHGQNMPAELALMRKSFLENAQNTNANIDAVRRTVHNDVTTLNENQLKFNSDVELLKDRFKKTNEFHTRLLFGLSGGLLLVLILCVFLLFKGGNSSTAARQVDDTEELRSKLGLGENVGEKGAEENTETTLDETSDPLPDKGTNNQLSTPSPEEKASPQMASSEISEPEEEEVATPKGPATEEGNTEPEEEDEPIMPLPKEAERIISARAGYAVTYFRRQSFDRLANKYFHPNKGVRFYPNGLNVEGYAFTRSNVVEAVKDDTPIRWGDINGTPIEMSFQDYYEKYIYDLDYEKESLVNYNELYASGKSGLSFSQIEERFPGCVFADYYKQGKSLILVFEKAEGRKSWYISAVIHNE
jgi:hypothetical protein